MLHRLSVILVAMLVLSSVASTAQAYLLPADYLLQQMIERRRRTELKDLTVQLTAEIAGNDATVEERIYLKTPERLRVERELAEGLSIYVEREGRRAGGTDGGLKRLDGASPDMLPKLLMPRGASTDEALARLTSDLKTIGIDTSVVSLTIYGADVREAAYVIGARPWEKDKPQLWLDQASYLPVRIVTMVPESGKRVRRETRLLEYGSSGTGDWFPRVIEDYRGAELVRRAEVTDIKANQSLPETLFQLPTS